MKRFNLYSALALLGNVIHLGTSKDGGVLYGNKQKPRPSKYPPSHPVAIELMENAQIKRERKEIKAWNDNLSRNKNYYRA